MISLALNELSNLGLNKKKLLFHKFSSIGVIIFNEIHQLAVDLSKMKQLVKNRHHFNSNALESHFCFSPTHKDGDWWCQCPQIDHNEIIILWKQFQQYHIARNQLRAADFAVKDKTYTLSRLIRYELLHVDLIEFEKTGKLPADTNREELLKKTKTCVTSMQHDQSGWKAIDVNKCINPLNMAFSIKK